MKKIMFNDRYGLTQAVLEGRKTMTRRFVHGYEGKNLPYGGIDGTKHLVIADNDKLFRSVYGLGDVVAVAQNYNEVFDEFATIVYLQDKPTPDNFKAFGEQSDVTLPKSMPGWNNKMFVKAELMPHQIRITHIRVERLKDISDEDCMKEGIFWEYGDYPYMATKMYKYNDKDEYIHPKSAFAALTDFILGKGTWKRNPWVFVYEFELVK